MYPLGYILLFSLSFLILGGCFWFFSRKKASIQKYLLVAKKETEEISQIALKTPYPLIQISENKVIFINPAALEAFPDVMQKGIQHSIFSDIKKFNSSSFPIKREVSYKNFTYDQTICLSTMAGKEAYIIYCYDVTQRKEYQRKLEQAYKETYAARVAAEQAKQARGDFLANMSHELRTPMNGIIGLSDILVSSEMTEEQRELAEAVNHSARNLLNVLNDVLDFSKIEAGEMKIEKIAFNLHDTIRQVFSLHSFVAEQKGVEAKIIFSENLPQHIITDPSRLQQILNNLIGNAVKFTASGSIVLSIDGKSDEKGGFMLCMNIIDTGIGIPVEKQKNIFSKFEQVDASISRQYGGTGLGLTITQNLVNLLNGKISLQSEENKGTNFNVLIPVDVASLVKSTEVRGFSEQRVPLNTNAKILIADDHPINLLYLDKALTDLGFKNFDKAHNGKKVIDLYHKNKYDLILMDCQMPEMDGYEATEYIRKKELQDIRTTIIAVTANAMKGASDNCIAAGMDDYISKPIDKKKLFLLLQKWLSSDNFSSEGIADSQDISLDNENEVFDWSRLNNFTNGDKKIISETVRIFTENLKIDLSLLEKNYHNKNYQEWERIAHKLCGSSANVGANVLARKCEEAQNISLDNMQKIEEFHQIILHESERVQEVLMRET